MVMNGYTKTLNPSILSIVLLTYNKSFKRDLCITTGT
jgi:hypothetical protein